MDDLAVVSGFSQEDRADRVRSLWDAYRSAHGDDICDMITDLAHLADVECGAGAGVDVLSRAELHYNAESPDPEDDTPAQAA